MILTCFTNLAKRIKFQGMFKTLLVFLFLSGLSYSQDDVVFFYGEHEFEASSTQYMFGDNVKLREKPSTDADVLETK